jgi:hypothetical protein
MSYEPSGEVGTGVSTKTELTNFSRIDDRSGGTLPGYTSLSSPQDMQQTVRPVAADETRAHDRSRKLAQMDALRRTLAKAKDTAGSMLTYAKTSELIELSVAGFRLLDLLDDLWKLRDSREDDWGDLLNILQGALSNEEFEKFTADRCDAILNIVADHLGSGAVGVDDIEQSIHLLRKNGLDPWKAISGDFKSHEDQ